MDRDRLSRIVIELDERVDHSVTLSAADARFLARVLLSLLTLLRKIEEV